MKQSTLKKLESARAYCDKMDKSTEFMIQYMQDVAGVDHDTVMEYLIRNGFNKHKNHKRMKTKQPVISIEALYQIFLKNIDLPESVMGEIQRKQLKGTFFAASGMMLYVMREYVADIEDEQEAIEFLEQLAREAEQHFDGKPFSQHMGGSFLS